MSTPTVPQPLLRSRMPELDTVRGVAVLMVIFYHGFYFATGAGLLHGVERWFTLVTDFGWTGVNLFFVLSGFLITGILVESRNRPDYYHNFYLRRALRILPEYYGVLLVVAIASRTGLVERPVSLGFLGLSFIYLSNMTELFGVPTQYAVLWSLAVEEHFYLLWPSAVRHASRRALPWICGSIVLICPALRAYSYWRHDQYGAGYTWLVADGLAWGALLALMARGRFSSRRRMFQFGAACTAASVLLALALLTAGIIAQTTFAQGVLRTSVINSFYAGALALVLVVGTGPWKGILHNRVLMFFGEISYGMYLIHMLIFDFVDRLLGLWGWSLVLNRGVFALVAARFAMAFVLTVGIAYLSRRYYEERFLRMKDRFTKVPAAVRSAPEDEFAMETRAAS